jgi:hypothetical protein
MTCACIENGGVCGYHDTLIRKEVERKAKTWRILSWNAQCALRSIADQLARHEVLAPRRMAQAASTLNNIADGTFDK